MIFKFDFSTVVKGLTGKKRNIQSFRILDSMEIDIPVKNIDKVLFFKNKTIEKTYFYCFEEKQFYCYDKHFMDNGDVSLDKIRLNMDKKEIYFDDLAFPYQSRELDTFNEKDIKNIVEDNKIEREKHIKTVLSNYVVCDGLVLRKCSMPVFVHDILLSVKDDYEIHENNDEDNIFFNGMNFNTDKIIDISDIHDFMQGMKNRRIDDFKVEIFKPECFVSLQKLFIFNKTRKVINNMSKSDILSFGDDSIFSFKNLCSFISKTEKEIGIPKDRSFLSSDELFKRFCTHIFDYKKFISYDLEEFNDLLFEFFCDVRKENNFSEEHMIMENKIKSLVEYVQNNILNKNLENNNKSCLNL